MTAEEIRKLAPAYSNNPANTESAKVILMREIAAQLADLNAKLTTSGIVIQQMDGEYLVRLRS